RLGHHRAVRLRYAGRHALRRLAGGVADVDLAAGDVVLPTIQRGRLSKPGNRVLRGRVGRGVRPRGVRRDGAVVDNPPAAGVLALHQPERLLRAEEYAGQVDVDDRRPLLVG